MLVLLLLYDDKPVFMVISGEESRDWTNTHYHGELG